ncbi:glycosyltransferase family 2 protein [Cochlodiniinecator piscidefendens]|uniref:glycosyltransferase family 2 protein n=1 Tax=Cochlodiniinecator piscidefendens TaxID=2715756 RepID=UPI00140B1A03|nr:glycosyltransferase family 2 protein [Cochlodiniinecator piscidefendens]
MKAERLRWGIVATISEPKPLVLAFMAHHLAMGAEEIHVYLDDVDDPVAPILERVPQIKVTVCDAAYWAEVFGKRPSRQTRRQTINATRAYENCSVDWLFHLDADEFLHLEWSLEKQVKSLQNQQLWIKFLNVERAFVAKDDIGSIFDGVFKFPPDPENPDVEYDTLFEHPLREGAFSGHKAGKAMCKTGHEMSVGLHAPRIGPMTSRNIPPFRHAGCGIILHFDGLSPLHWAAKLLRYAAAGTADAKQMVGGKRLAQVALVADLYDDLDALRALHDEVNAISQENVEFLRTRGHLADVRLNPASAIATWFPDEVVDLSVEAFDALLMPRVKEYQYLISQMDDWV